MHKLLIFSSVAVLTAVAFVNTSTEAYATGLQGSAPSTEIDENPNINTAGGGINTSDLGLQAGIRNLGNLIARLTGQLSNETRGDLARQTEALQTTAGIGMGSAARNASAVSMNNAIAHQGAQIAAARTTTQGIAEQACALGTSTMSYGTAESHAFETASTQLADRLPVLNAEEGSISENGLVDMNNQMFEVARSFCTPTGEGGDAVFCTGTDNEHVSIGTLLFRPNVGLGVPSADNDVEQLEYLQDLLYARVPVKLNPDLLVNPNTEVKNLYVESDRLRAELSIGQAAFSQVVGERTAPENEGRSIPYIQELLDTGNFLSPEQVAALFPDNRASAKAQLDAITLGMLNPNFLQQQLVANPNAMGINISYNTALTNRLLFKMLNELEFIKLAIATDIAATRGPQVDSLNARITAMNER